MESSKENSDLPAEIEEQAKIACLNLLPKKSKAVYEKEFQLFNTWKKEKGILQTNEKVLLAYFLNLRKRCAISSMWTKYSMLKTNLKIHVNLDISKYGKLIAYLKGESRSYKPKKAKVLDKNQIEEFLLNASDSEYLMIKTALVMGIFGACRCQELTQMSIDDIEDKGSYWIVSIPDSKTNKSRSFTIIDEGCAIKAVEICKKYMSLRPANVSHRRFFLNYKNEKCTVQPVGLNTLSKIPSKIASYLKLPEPEAFTGHSLRRSSATLLVNGGGDITALKRHGGWRSNTVAEGYIEESISEKIKTAKRIHGEQEVQVQYSNKHGAAAASSTAKTINLVAEDSKSVCINLSINVIVNK